MASRLKELMVDEMAKEFAGLERKGCVVVGWQGLKAEDSHRVRMQLSRGGARITVVRNAMFSIALDRLGAAELKDLLHGPTAVVIGEDPVSTAKVVEDALREFSVAEIKGGLAEGQLLDGAAVKRLAELPSRETLLAQAVTCFVGPAQQFANCLAGLLSQLANVFEQLRRKKEGESSSQESEAG